MAPSGASRLSGAKPNENKSMALPNAMPTKPPIHSGCSTTFGLGRLEGRPALAAAAAAAFAFSASIMWHFF